MLPLLTTAERAAFEAANGEALPDAPEPFHRVFARRAAVGPDTVAVRAEDGVLTYGALDRSANQLAHLLRDRGVGPEVAVGLCLDRGARLAVAVLGVLKAGGVYVPLAPDEPAERRAGVVADAGAAVVLSDGPLDLPGCEVVDLAAAADDLGERPGDAPPACADPAAEPASAAYILYTSGTTGKPKGVVVEHRQLTAYVDGIIARLGVDRPMRFAMAQPLTVDSSVTAFFPPLCTGGEVHLLSRATAIDPDRLAAWVTEHGVDCLKIAPSHLRSLQTSPRFTELLPARLLVVGGEASSWHWLRALQESLPHCQVHNHYGPTETTVGVLTLAVTDHLDAEWDMAPIGRPLPGVRVAVVDRNGQEVPVGVVGELVVCGVTVARGYHERPELTAAAFGPGGGRYATGDFVRRLADGTVVFMGRRDDQVKVRGFRVELGEVDAALRAHSGVCDAVTVVREDVPGDRAIVSYVEPAGLLAGELLRHVRTLLPPHMVPRAVVVLDRLPLSPHGKVDRSALPPPAPTKTGTTPETDLERVVASAWQEVLGTGTVGAEVNFFDVGGHSLLLVELQQRLRAALDREVELLDLLAHVTVRDQARLLAGAPEPARAEPGRPRSPQQAALLRRRMRQRRTKGERRD
jgi:amino acid adenylation domain-containing protein